MFTDFDVIVILAIEKNNSQNSDNSTLLSATSPSRENGVTLFLSNLLVHFLRLEIVNMF